MAKVRDEARATPALDPVRSEPAGATRPSGGDATSRVTLARFLAILGPGVIAATAGNDAGGITTYSTVGATYGYSLLWAMVLITISLALVQEMCARMGAVTGKGLTDLIRENFGIRRTALVMLALMVANAATTISEFIGIGAALDLFGIKPFISVPVCAFGVWWLVTKGSYKRVEKIFLVLALGFLAYPVSAFLAHPNWGEVARATVTPTLQLNAAYLGTFIATVGTTITPYMQIYLQSSVSDKGVTLRDYPLERLEVFLGVLFASLISMFIIIACAAVLHPAGIAVDSAADAAQALAPFVGPWATYLFGAGLFGACVLAAGVLPLSTAYSFAEAFGFDRGVSRTFREAPVFHTIFTGLIVLGALVAVIPNLPIVDVLLKIQVVNGLILPIVLISIITLVNDRSLMGTHTNGPLYNAVAWGTIIMVTALSLGLIGLSVLQGVGVIGA